MKKFCIILILTFILINPVAQNAFAQIGEGIKISPVRFENTVNPGDVISETLKVTNESGGVREMKMFVRDFKAEGEEGAPKLLEPGSEEGSYLSSWIQTDITDFQFQPGEEKDVNFNIVVPANAGPGGYYGAVVMGTVPPNVETQSADKGAAITTSHQTAALLLFRVAGDVEENAMIKDFKPAKRLYGMPFKVDFLTRIENSGNVHLKPAGMIEIYNMLGEKKISLPFNDKNSNILPDSVRKFQNQWEGKLGFGKHKASLVVSYGTSASEGGQGKKTLDSISYFWIVPWKILLPSIIGILSLIALVIAVSRFYRNRAVRKVIEELGAGQTPVVKKTLDPSSRLPIGLITAFFLALIFLIGVIVYFIFFA